MNAQRLSAVITLVLFFGSALAVATFVVLYALLARWEDSSLGRHIMSFSVATGLVLVQGLVGYAIPHYPGQLVLRPLVYGLFLAVWVWRIIIFVLEQRDARRDLAARQVRDVLGKTRGERP